ncbi:molecular chaperone DnaJ [Caulobacter sp. DWR2-3-1b2]|uniref:molecular chaperone DnaJ n=1 Tax=unclassified Caulobacter TaxID=2648921 RepID=UPI0019C1E076|nr:molecular chaperone DnaJ [Caulobacter sp.]
MFYLLLGGLLLLFILSGRASRLLKGDGWRVGAGALAIVSFAGAGYAGVRQAWEVCIVLLVIGIWTATTARQRPIIRKVVAKSDVSLSEARSILGVGPQASKAEVQAAYARLMRLAHPDKGGTAGLAAQLNAARDRLLGGK